MLKFGCFAFLVFFGIGNCASITNQISPFGKISESYSKFDETRVVRMSPVLAKHGLTDIQAKFGLYWDSNKQDIALLEVHVGDITNFDPKALFELKIDGELISLPVADSKEFSVVDGYSSHKNYIVTKEQVIKIANGLIGVYRIKFLNNTYSVGKISYKNQKAQDYVPYSFRNFYNKVWGVETNKQ